MEARTKLETWERQEIVKLNPHDAVRNGILNAGVGGLVLSRRDTYLLLGEDGQRTLEDASEM